MKRDAKRVGGIAEAAVALAFTREGYDVSKPFAENQRYDLIVDEEGVSSRVQSKDGTIEQGRRDLQLLQLTTGIEMESPDRPYTGEIETPRLVLSRPSVPNHKWRDSRSALFRRHFVAHRSQRYGVAPSSLLAATKNRSRFVSRHL